MPRHQAEEAARRAAEEAQRLASEAAEGLVHSQVVEDMNNHQKNDQTITGFGSKFRRPQTIMASSIVAQVMSDVHKFDQLPAATLAHDSKALEMHDFKCTREPTIPIVGIATTEQKADFFSLCAENIGIPIADLSVVRTLYRAKSIRRISTVWQGFFNECSHHLVWRYKGETSHQAWKLGLFHFKDSASLVWPCNIELFAGNAELETIKLHNIDGPRLSTVVDYRAVEARTYTWRSWSWQVKRTPKELLVDAIPGVRAFIDSPIADLLSVAADEAFWVIGRMILDQVAEDIGINPKTCKSEYQLLWEMILKILVCRRGVLRQNDEAHGSSSEADAALRASQWRRRSGGLPLDGGQDGTPSGTGLAQRAGCPCGLF